MIICIEDDDNIRELVIYTLAGSGFRAKGFADGESFFSFFSEQAARQRIDLILLDIMLPGEDGLSILKKLRGRADTRTLPVMLLTARGNEYDKVTGLDLGADDYVVKPFGMMELMARIRALLRRASREAPRGELSVGKLRLCPDERTAFVDGVPLRLTMKEFDLLQVLLCSTGRVFTREFLLTKVWGYEGCVETRTLDVHVRSLRQKLGVCGEAVETLRGVGYRLNAASL